MISMKNILVSLFLFGITGILMSFETQPDGDQDCRKELQNYMKQLRKINFPIGKTVYFMDVSVSVVTSPDVAATKTRVKMYMNASQLHCISESYSTYQDDRYTFVIFPERKLIIWSQGASNPDSNLKLNQTLNFQDSVVNQSKITSCELKQNATGAYKVVTMEPWENLKEQQHIARMEYHINQTNHKVEKAITYYQPGEKIYSKSLTYNEVDLNYTKMKMNKPVYYQVFSDQNKLLSKYKGYQVIDQRD